MSWSATHEYPHSKDNEACGYCGCVFEVLVLRQDGHNENEEYYCPECRKEFTTWASSTPGVTLISKRTDGKTDTL